jgi:hypothetical protein
MPGGTVLIAWKNGLDRVEERSFRRSSVLLLGPSRPRESRGTVSRRSTLVFEPVREFDAQGGAARAVAQLDGSLTARHVHPAA